MPKELKTESKSILQVTAVNVYPIRNPPGPMRAEARVVLNDELQLTRLRVISGTNGLFVAYPNDPVYAGEDYKSLYYPVTKPLREEIERAILAKYSEMVPG